MDTAPNTNVCASAGELKAKALCRYKYGVGADIEHGRVHEEDDGGDVFGNLRP